MTPLSALVAVPDGAIDQKNLLGTIQLIRVPERSVEAEDAR